GRDHAFVRLKHGQVGDIARRPVRVVGGDEKLLLGVVGQDALRWLDGDALQHWRVRGSARRAGGDPPAQSLVMRAALFKALAAAVGHLGASLLQEQTVFRRSRKDAPAAGLAGEGSEIEVGVEAEQGELETILAACLAVAGTGV